MSSILTVYHKDQCIECIILYGSRSLCENVTFHVP